MKNLFSLAIAVLAVIAISACESGGMKQTESGLQYKFLKKGDGQKVEVGSYIRAKLSLMVEDSVVWTTYESPDSVFSFVAGKSGVIPGFEEMALMMREGDNVYVSIPDSLAYGERGAGEVIPPNATIVYDHYELVSVSAPKLMLTDTISKSFQTGGVELATQVFEGIALTDAKEEFHMELDLVEPMLRQLLQVRQVDTLLALVNSFEKAEWHGDLDMLAYYKIAAMQGLGQIDEAIALTKECVELYPEAQWTEPALQQLEMIKAQQATEK